MAISAYFAVFGTSAFAAAEPARTAVSARCDATNVSGDVTSHVRHRPCAQGIIHPDVLPSDQKIILIIIIMGLEFVSASEDVIGDLKYDTPSHHFNCNGVVSV